MHRLSRRRFLLVSGALGLAISSWARPSLGAQATPTEGCSEDTIGVATMADDGTITLDLRAALPHGGHGHAHLVYPASHPDYAVVLNHVGSLQPGETRCVPPWPDEATVGEE